MLTFSCLIIALITLAYVWLKIRFNYWSRKGIPQIGGSFPYGSLKGVSTKIAMYEKYDEIYQKFKGKASFVGFYAFLSPKLLILDPELLKQILTSNFNSFNHSGMYYNKEDDPLSANLQTLEGDKGWRERRTNLTPIFSSGKIKMMFENINRVSDRFAEAIENALTQPDQKMSQWVKRYTADSIGSTAFGFECGCIDDENSPIFKIVQRFFNPTRLELLKIFFSHENPKLANRLGFRYVPKEPADFFLKTMLDTFEYRENIQIERKDFVSLLLGLKDSFTKVELAAEASLLFAGGYENTSTTIAFTLYELALQQDIQDRLRDEIRSKIDENEGKVTYELMQEMKYLDMVVSENLRKNPPVSDNARKCTKDFQVPGMDFVIKKGEVVEFNLLSFHRDEEYFPDPLKFDPERFNKENVKNIKPYTYLPFGAGPRNCIGMRYGLMQSKLALIKLLYKFKFLPCEKTTIPMKFSPSHFSLSAINGIWLKVVKT